MLCKNNYWSKTVYPEKLSNNDIFRQTKTEHFPLIIFNKISRKCQARVSNHIWKRERVSKEIGIWATYSSSDLARNNNNNF